MRRSIAFLCLLIGTPAGAQVGTRGSVPIHMPQRPFLLVDAPRRFVPAESAHVRVQLRDGGEVQLSLFRVHEPATLLGQAGHRQGVTLAPTRIGEEAERLLSSTGPLPRRGRGLTLVRERHVTMPRAEGMRRVGDETVVYDSNEDIEDDVATYWVREGSWSVRELSLGRLRPGLYIAQIRAAAWVSSALLSVGDLVLLARRGDRRDVVRVTDAEGAPQRGVLVRAFAGEREVSSERSDANGMVRFAASAEASLRFRAERGDDLAWVDIPHVRLAPCDARVYVATGRPVYRNGERMYVRGHVRGCDGDGFVGLAGRTVTLSTGGDPVEATTDPDGNFVAQLEASALITATLDGREHRRDVQIDHRSLPRRALVVELDRPWAAAGDIVRVRVSDDQGGWPNAADVILDTPDGRLLGTVGPGRPAVFHVRIPAMDEAASRMQLHASLSEHGRVTMAGAEIFVGRSAVQLELDAPEERGVSGERFAFEARASDLGGQPVDGPIRFRVYGSDGNRAVGPPRHTFEARLRDGRVAAQIPLVGRGPWMIRAERGEASAQLVVWSRRRPPALSNRGELAILPRSNRVRAGETLAIDVRVPRGGEAWLTLEQGGVLVDRRVRSAARVTRITITVPDRARGLASLVLAHVHRGRVRTASATVEVATSMPVSLEVETDRRVYGESEIAHVTIEAKTDGDRPHDAVVSLWLADAGYWGLGDERYPLPDVYLRLPGRPASGGDSQTPIAYGAEEGRRLDSELIFDGRRLDQATHRHGWHHGGEVIRMDASGSFSAVAAALARAARLRGSEVHCDEEHDDHTLRVRDLPWDLVAMRVGAELSADVRVVEERLVFDCSVFGMGGMGMGGTGSGAGAIGLGVAGPMGPSREERLEGTLHFVGLRRLGPDGRIELDVPLPDHPGRWRIEVLAIADDGGGARAHRVVHTRNALETWVDVAHTLRPGDRVEGAVRVQSHAGETHARVTLRLSAGLRLTRTPPAEIALDAQGRGSAPFAIEAISPGPGAIVVEAATPQHSDRVRTVIDVMAPSTQRALFYGVVVGPGATEVDVPLPELASLATLTLDLAASNHREVEHLFEALTDPRWDVAVMRADRLASLAALRRALHGDRSATVLRSRITHAIRSELAALRTLQTSNGELGWGDRPDPALTLEVLEQVPRGQRPEWADAIARLRQRISAGELHGGVLARAIRVLDIEAQADARLVTALRESRGIRALAEVVLSAGHFGHDSIRRRAADRLIRDIDARLAHGAGPTSCAGWTWWLCFERRGERGQLARAALALRRAGDPRAHRVAGRVGEWIARQPVRPSGFAWGTDEPDILELLARQPRGSDRPLVMLDGRRVAARGGVVTVPAGAHRLSLRFAERTGRLRRVVITGDVTVRAPLTSQGNVRLERRFERRDGRWEGSLSFHLPRRARHVTIDVPLPAGLTVDRRQLAERHASIIDGTLRLRVDAVQGGSHTLRIPMIPTGTGTFTAGPALLVAAGGSLYGLTPVQRVEVSR